MASIGIGFGIENPRFPSIGIGIGIDFLSSESIGIGIGIDFGPVRGIGIGLAKLVLSVSVSHVVCNHPEDQATSYVKPSGRFRDGFQKRLPAAGYGVTLANSV